MVEHCAAAEFQNAIEIDPSSTLAQTNRWRSRH
jgi:hypothetical protein